MIFLQLLVKSIFKPVKSDFTNMKTSQSSSLTSAQLTEATKLGQLLARLRTARRVKQVDAAIRSGLSRNTVYRMEHGDPGIAFGQILRYLDAIAPGTTLGDLYAESDPALAMLRVREQTKRVRDMSSSELDALDF